MNGWTPRVQRSDAVSRTTILDTGSGTGRSIAYNPVNHAAEQNASYDAIKARCIANKTLWEDPDFPATKESLFFKKPPSVWPNIKWKRPKVRPFLLLYACIYVS